MPRFIDLCNEVLRRLNEVEIPEPDFANTRGVQSLAKDAVRASIAKINQQEFGWPFNAAQQTVILAVGQSEYVWPEALKIADWDSFQIQADPSQGVGFSRLKHIKQDEWYKYFRDQDFEAGPSGSDIPKYVFASHGSGFGVSPVPDKPYTLTFRYFLNFADLQDANDLTRVPAAFSSVIVDGALFHMYMFKDNPESAGIAMQAFSTGLKALENLYLNNSKYIYDGRVNFGGGGNGRGGRPFGSY